MLLFFQGAGRYLQHADGKVVIVDQRIVGEVLAKDAAREVSGKLPGLVGLAVREPFLAAVVRGQLRDGGLGSLEVVQVLCKAQQRDGGPGGLMAALTAKRRGHDVILLEKENRLGGTLNYLEHDCHKGDLMTFKDYLIRQVSKNGVDIRLNTTADKYMLESLHPDYVLCAVGSEPIVPPIPGLAENAMTAKQLASFEGEVGHEVVLIGGGLSGAEMGLSYAELGHHVTIIEMTSKIAAQANHMHGPAIEETMERLKDNLTLLTSTKCVSVKPGAVEVEGPDGQRYDVKGDLIINCLGQRPRSKVAAELAKADVPIFEILGDARELAQVRGAVYGGYFLAMDIR